jgi:hypothetical protein
MYVPVFGVVSVYGCNPLQGLPETVLQVCNGLFSKLSQARVSPSSRQIRQITSLEQ